MADWMIYGANGYTGELCAREAARRGLRPVLAGRNREAVEKLGKELGLETRVFTLESAEQIADQLGGVLLVLHCAGPFSATSEPMLLGCAGAGVHYLDITGEIDVFEYVHQNGNRWQQAGFAAIPGVGMDVVPTDCLAAKLAATLLGANRLELAFRWPGRISPGTMKTSVEGASRGARRRIAGRIVDVPPGTRRRVAFADGEANCVAIPWGDVSTAYYSTGIGDITVYTTLPDTPRVVQKFMGIGAVQNAAKGLIEALVRGPDQAYRETARTQVWGRVADENGAEVNGTLAGPEGYRFTVLTALGAVERFLKEPPRPGALMPSMALGPGFVDTIDGVQIRLTAPASA
jgi:short subunit dehydrogenase-like uncharacterized protein